ERFQRTRGVLRLMAAAIHALWVRGDRSLLIQPGSLPLDTPRVRDEILRYLPEGWNTVMDRDVDGARSEPRRIDEENPHLREREKGDFRAVSWWADPSGSDVADEQAVRLVVLQSGHRYRRNRMDAEALAVVSRILEQRGNSPRQFRNMLVFVAPDAEAMEGLDLEVRRYLAWRSIVDEQEILNLDAHQRRQAQDSMKRADETVSLRLREAYSWLLVPAQEAGGAWQWEATRIPGDGSIPHRACRKLRDSEQLITRWSPALLRMELDRWLWKDVPHLGVKKLWEYLCTYGYLPRLQDQDVLLEAIAEGLRSRDYFGSAGRV